LPVFWCAPPPPPARGLGVLASQGCSVTGRSPSCKLAYYCQLYELERAAKDFSDAQRLQMRQDLAVPILGQFCTWLEAQRPEVLPKSPMGEAIGYALNNWAALARYADEDGGNKP
jgi:hypothetical protein